MTCSSVVEMLFSDTLKTYRKAAKSIHSVYDHLFEHQDFRRVSIT